MQNGRERALSAELLRDAVLHRWPSAWGAPRLPGAQEMKAPSRFSYTEAPSATMCVAWGSWVPARRALEPAFFFSCAVGRPGCSAGDAGSKVNGTQITPISSCQPPFRATVPLRPLVPQSENRRLGPQAPAHSAAHSHVGSCQRCPRSRGGRPQGVCIGSCHVQRDCQLCHQGSLRGTPCVNAACPTLRCGSALGLCLGGSHACVDDGAGQG